MPATVALEELWNAVLADSGVSLLCAYEDVFGAAGDTDRLRGHIAAEFRGRTRMPASQSALLGLRNVAPPIAESVLERARHHYGR